MKNTRKKKTLLSLLCLLLFCLGVTVSAYAAEGFAENYPRVMDEAALLSASEERSLRERLDEISLRQKLEVTLVTTDSLDGYPVSAYAEMCYESCDYGYGEDRDGILLLISMEDRDWYIATHGYAITAFTDAGLDYIGEQLLSDLSEGSYAAAFDRYADLCDQFITQAGTGEPYDNGNFPQEPLSAVWLLISLGIGIVLALLIVGGMKAQLQNVRPQKAAGSYLKAGGLKLTESRDLFLYHTVTRTARPKQSSSSGSSTHRSSSGRSYGGRGGKF